MKILLNGKQVETESGQNIEQLVLARKFEPSRVVVELNGDIVCSAFWRQTKLKENDRIELICFVGGG